MRLAVPPCRRNGFERKLAAILAADVAGYSRLTGADEEGTHERLKAHLRQMADPKIKEYRGRIVKNTGDGMLVEFSRVVDAVSFCSVLAGDARFSPRFLLLLGELAMCLGEAREVAPGLAIVVDSTGPADSRRSPASCEPPPASRGRGEIKIELRRHASF